VARYEGTCGAEKDIIVTFKFEKKEEIVKRILERTVVKSNLAGIVYELTFQDRTFRLYSTGKAIFRSIKNRQELNSILAALLL
jgi:hypothetical protein